MLVLSRKTDEVIQVDGPCRLTVVSIKGKAVRLGIEADPDVAIVRGELERRPRNETREAAPTAA